MSLAEEILNFFEDREEQHNAITYDYATNDKDDGYSILDED